MKKNTRLVLLAVLLVVMVAVTMMVASAATIDVLKGDDLAAKVAGAAAGDTINLTDTFEVNETLKIDKDLTFTGTGTVKASAGFSAEVLIEITGSAHVVVKSGNYIAPCTVFKVSGTATAEFGSDEAEIIVRNTAAAASGTFAAVDVSTTSDANPAVTLGNGWYTFLGSYDKSDSKPTPPSASGSTALLINSTAIINIDGGKLSYKYKYDTKSSNTNDDGSSYGLAIIINVVGATVNMLDGGLYHGGSSYMIYSKVASSQFTFNISGGELYFYRLWGGVTNAMIGSNLHITGGTFRNNAKQTNNGTWIAASKDMTILIEGGDFQAGTGNGNHMLHLNERGNYTITGGTFVYKQSGSSTPCMIRISDSNASVTISGGTFTMTGTQGTFIEKNNAKVVAISNATFINNNSNAPTFKILNVNGALTIDNCTFSGTGFGTWMDVKASAKEISISNTTVVSIGHTIYVSPDSKVAPVKFNLTSSSFTSMEGRALKDANGHVSYDDSVIFVSHGPDEDAAVFRVDGEFYKWDEALLAVQDGGVIEVVGNAQWALIVSVDKTFTITCAAPVDGSEKSVIGGLVVSKGHITMENVNLHTKRGDCIVMSVADTSLLIKSGTFRTDGMHLISVTNTDASVVIEGGSFESTGSNHVIMVNNGVTTIDGLDATKVPVLIKGGNFKGSTLNYIVNIDCCARVDVLGGNFEGGQAWFHINKPGIFNLGDAANPTALVCKDAVTRAIWLRNASLGGQVNINGGVYSLSKDCGASYYINAAGATLTINGGKFSGRISIISMHDGDCVSPVIINNGEFIMEYTASVVVFSANVSNNLPEKAGSLTVNGGYFKAEGKGDIFSIKADKKDAFVKITGGTFEAVESRIVFSGSCMANVTITGGTFLAGGSRVFYFDSSSNIFHIDGGIFKLLDKASGGYADDALIFCGGNAKSTVRITGGTFINERKNSKQLVRVQNESCGMYMAGGNYYMSNGEGFFVNDLNDSNNSVPVYKDKKATVEGKEYFSFVIREGHDYAPIPLLLPSMRVNMEAQGMRFTSIIPASTINSVIAAGASDVSYGTIIVPAEFLKDLDVVDGDYFAALKALAASKSLPESKVFVDIPAVEGIEEVEKNGERVEVVIHASLVNIKQENWNRAMVGISYVKATTDEGDVYYFSAANVDGAISFSKAAENAYNDVKDAWQKLGSKVYAYRSIKDGKSFSRFAPSVQESLKKYFTPAK